MSTMQQIRVRRQGTCTHQPHCPPVEDSGRAAARLIVAHPEQGWSLLCNGIVLFDDGGLLLPDKCAEAPHRCSHHTIAA